MAKNSTVNAQGSPQSDDLPPQQPSPQQQLDAAVAALRALRAQHIRLADQISRLLGE